MTGKSLCLWPCSWVNKNRNKKTSRPQETDTATNKGLPFPRLLSVAQGLFPVGVVYLSIPLPTLGINGQINSGDHQI